MFGYEGNIWPLASRWNELYGLPTFRSVEELPGPIQVALLAVSASPSNSTLLHTLALEPLEAAEEI